MALPFTKEAMQENKNGFPQRYTDEHEPMDKRFVKLKKLTADFLTARGYNVLVNTPASVVDDDLRSLLPQKTLATLAVIGWIGKCALLIINEVGSAIRLTAVLTNAPLDCGKPVTESKCDPKCTVCVDICPGKAPSGILWETGVDRDSFFAAHACHDAARSRA